MKKLLITCAAVMTACVAFAAGSMAATYELATCNADKTEVTLGATAAVNGLADGQQLTVVIVPAAADGTRPTEIDPDAVLYINQDAKGSLSLTDMKVKTALTEGVYYVLVGGENLGEEGIIVDKLTVGASTPTGVPVMWGDLNSNSELDLPDLNALVSGMLEKPITENMTYVVGTEVATGIMWGDLNSNGELDLPDLNALVSGMLEKPITENMTHVVGQEVILPITN